MNTALKAMGVSDKNLTKNIDEKGSIALARQFEVKSKSVISSGSGSPDVHKGAQ